MEASRAPVFNHASFIWSAADLLRGIVKQHQYGDVTLPFTVLARLVAVIESLLAAVTADDNLRAIAGANTRADFAFSPGLQAVTEDAVWQVKVSSNPVLEALRGMPWKRLRETVT